MTTHEMAKQLMAMPDVPIMIGGWPMTGMYQLMVRIEAQGAVIGVEFSSPSHKYPSSHPFHSNPPRETKTWPYHDRPGSDT